MALSMDEPWEIPKSRVSRVTGSSLAEELQAPLITRDQRIAAAPGHKAAVEVF